MVANSSQLHGDNRYKERHHTCFFLVFVHPSVNTDRSERLVYLLDGLALSQLLIPSAARVEGWRWKVGWGSVRPVNG